MSKFAKIDEEVYRRQDELTGEEFRLYCIIFFHTFVDAGICRRSLRQLALIYSLNYTHTTERFKILLMDFNNLDEKEKEKRRQKIKSPWCQKVKGGIRPLVGLNVPKTGTLESEIFRKAEHQYSENRNTDVPESGTFGDEMFRKPEHTYKEYIEPLKSRDFPDTTHGEKTAGARVENENNLSKFSLDECLNYTLLCRSKGDDIRNPRALAITLHKTGEADAFIQATLYPIPTATAEPLDERILKNVLWDMQALEYGENELREYEKNFTSEDWTWLMENREK